MILKREEQARVEIEAMPSSRLLILAIVVWGGLGAGIGYFYRFRVQLRRFATVLAAVLISLMLEITSGTLSGKMRGCRRPARTDLTRAAFPVSPPASDGFRFQSGGQVVSGPGVGNFGFLRPVERGH